MTTALREDLSARELERKISDLKRDRVRIEDTIRRMESNQQRIFREANAERSRVQAAQDDDKPETAGKEDKESRKRRRSRSGSGSDSESKKSDKEATGDKDKEDKEGKEDKEEKEDKEDKGDKEGNGEKAEEAGEAKAGERKRNDTRPKKSDPRSRNLFGKLLGHLHSAKSRLETEKGSKAAELHAKAQERINEKLSLSKMNIREFRKEQFEERKKEEEAKVVQIEKTIEEMELLLLQKRLEGHYSLMMNFIRTKAEPTIFYLPAKHTKDTEHALEETRAAIKHKTASLKVQLQPAQAGDDTQASEDALRASAAAAAAALVEAPAKEDGDAKEDAKEDDADAKGDEGTPAKEKPESDKKQAPSDDEEDQEDKAEDDKAADSDASSSKKRKASADDGDSKSKKRKDDGSASE